MTTFDHTQHLTTSHSNQWEHFEFQIKHNTEKRKTIEDFYKIIEERAYVEDQYSKGMDRIINSFEQLNLGGNLQEALQRIITGQKERVSLGRSHTLLVRKGVLEPMKDMMKKQSNEVKSWTAEEKKLEKEYKNYIERIEKLKNEFISKAKECDGVGLEAESMLLNKKASEEDKTKFTQKYTESQNIKMDKETAYQGKILEYNSFLEQFQRDLEKINKSLVSQELEINGWIQQALIKFLDYEKVQALSYEQNVIPLIKTLETIDVRDEIMELPEDFTGTKELPSPIGPVEFKSFFERGLFELKEGVSPKDEEIMIDFKIYYDEIIKEEKKEIHSRFQHEDLEKQELEALNFIACLMCAAWRGKNINNDNMHKLQKLMSTRLYRNIIVACLQQYRLAGKFTLGLDGFRNIKTILFYLLDECLDERDIINTIKVMILSLTFWKLSRGQDGTEEKKYLQDGIQWHPIWKDLDFWSTANYLSLREEIMKKGSSSKEEIESEKESHERQNMIVYSQLLSYAYNMSSFGIDRSDIKKITQQFYQYYSLDDCRVKELMNAIENINKEMENSGRSSPGLSKDGRTTHRRGNSLIKGFFIKKSLDSPEMSVREIRSKDFFN